MRPSRQLVAVKTGAFSSALKRKLPFLGGLCALDSPWRGPKRQLLAVSAKDKNATHATTSSSETDRQLVADGTEHANFDNAD